MLPQDVLALSQAFAQKFGTELAPVYNFFDSAWKFPRADGEKLDDEQRQFIAQFVEQRKQAFLKRFQEAETVRLGAKWSPFPFVRALLYNALKEAGPDNAVKIYRTWPDLWTRCLERGKAVKAAPVVKVIFGDGEMDETFPLLDDGLDALIAALEYAQDLIKIEDGVACQEGKPRPVVALETPWGRIPEGEREGFDPLWAAIDEHDTAEEAVKAVLNS